MTRHITDQQILDLTPSIHSLARKRSPKYKNSPIVDLEDLFQAGMEGVCQAAIRWQPGRASFPKYALQRAEGEMADLIRRVQPSTRRVTYQNPLSLDAHKLRRRNRDVREPDRDMHNLIGDTDDPSVREAWEVIVDLPGTLAPTVALFLAGWTITEISERDGVSQSAISHRLDRARRRLQPLLAC